jgi:hypothetical protein
MEEDINTIITKEEIEYLQYEILRWKNESKNNWWNNKWFIRY